ncbi:hypothetical protein ACTFIZ_000673 [Dictyostelium cf. discoideum]
MGQTYSYYLSTLPMSYIIASTFDSDNDKYYSVLRSNSPVTIEDCIFNSNVKNITGDLFSTSETSLTVKNSKMVNPYKSLNDLPGSYRSSVVFDNSDILFDGCTFGESLFGINCYNSSITFNNSINLNPFYYCHNCGKLMVDSDSICLQSSTTSTFSNNSLKLIPNNHLIFTFILLIITIISSSLFVFII